MESNSRLTEEIFKTHCLSESGMKDPSYIPLWLERFNTSTEVSDKTKMVASIAKSDEDVLKEFLKSNGPQLIARELEKNIADHIIETELVDKLMLFFFKSNPPSSLISELRLLPLLKKAKKCTGVPANLQCKIEKLYKKLNDLSSDGYHPQSHHVKKFIKRSIHIPRRDSEEDDRSHRNHNNLHKRPDQKNSKKKFEKVKKRHITHNKIRWTTEDSLVQVKYFKGTDEPNREPLTEEELKAYSCESHNQKATFEENKHKEALMEGKRRKENELETSHKLDSMKEEIIWVAPSALKLEDKEWQIFGRESTEKIRFEKMLSSCLQKIYFREADIPIAPQDRITNRKSPRDPFQIKFSIPSQVMDKLINSTENGQMSISRTINGQSKMEEEEKRVVKGILKFKLTATKEKKKEISLDPSVIGQIKDLLKKINECSEIDEQLEKEISDVCEKLDSDMRINFIKNIKTLIEKKENSKKNGSNQSSTQHQSKQPPQSQAQQPAHSKPPAPHLIQAKQNYESPNLNPKMKNLLQQTNSKIDDSPKRVQGSDDEDYLGDDHLQKQYKPQNYKTVPCIWFHSEKGCDRGGNCHFIHDMNYPGKKTPNMDKYVRPIHSLSKKPSTNYQNMMIMTGGSNSSGEEIKSSNNTMMNNYIQTQPPLMSSNNVMKGPPQYYPENGSGHFMMQQHQVNVMRPPPQYPMNQPQNNMNYMWQGYNSQPMMQPMPNPSYRQQSYFQHMVPPMMNNPHRPGQNQYNYGYNGPNMR